jgi:ABC-2 type transport system ATP-binding protein
MISIEKLVYHYPKQPRLFNDLSLHLGPGNIVGLLGKNGAGKTTLLRLITGLTFPLSGKIDVMGFKPLQRSPAMLNDVFFVPEEYFLPSIAISEYCKGHSLFYPKFDMDMFNRILLKFELWRGANLGNLSQGQRKKFYIAFTLATRCRLLVMDEPTNGLDIPSKILFRKIVASVLTDDQLVIISTHQVKDVENLIDQIVIIDQGRIIFNEPISAISNRLSFSETSSLQHDNIIYSEQVPGGFKIITPKNGQETIIDIELLFNAVTNGKLIMQ